MENSDNPLNTLLQNPETMKKLMTMAQALAGQPQQTDEKKNRTANQPMTELPTVLNQEKLTLLNALRPYLSPQRVRKLERAMQASQIAQMAAVMLKNQPPVP